MIEPLIPKRPEGPQEPCFMDEPLLPKKFMDERMYLIVAPMVLATGEMAIGVAHKNGECRHFAVIIKSGARVLAEATCFNTGEEASRRGNEILVAIQGMMKTRLGYKPIDTMAN